jgi:hypothetical protein
VGDDIKLTDSIVAGMENREVPEGATPISFPHAAIVHSQKTCRTTDLCFFEEHNLETGQSNPA